MTPKSLLVLAFLITTVLAGCMDKSAPTQPDSGDMRVDFTMAVYSGDEAAVSNLLATEPLLLNAPNPAANNQTPLHVAAKAGNASMIKLLLEQGADPYAVDDEGQTPAEVAVMMGAGQDVIDLLQGQ